MSTSRDLYEAAMKESADLLEKIRSLGDDPSRQIVSDVLANRRNTPYVTTIYEAIQEMDAPLKQRAS